MGFFRRHSSAPDGGNGRRVRSQSDTGGAPAQSLTLSPFQVTWGSLENTLERCAAKLTLATVRLERLSEYYDRDFAGSDHAGIYEKSAWEFRKAASGINLDHNLLGHPGTDFDELWDYFEAHARNVGRALDMPESEGYDKNVDDTVDLVEETLRDLLDLQHAAEAVLQRFSHIPLDKTVFCEGLLRKLRGSDGALATLFAVYFDLSSLRMLQTHPSGLTFVPDVAYEPRLTEGWQPIQPREPVRSGPFEYLQPPRFEFDPNLEIIRMSNSDGQYRPFENTVCHGREGVLVPCCTDPEARYFGALIGEWTATLGPGNRKPDEYPEIPF